MSEELPKDSEAKEHDQGDSFEVRFHPEHMLLACCIEKPEYIDGLREGIFGDERARQAFGFLRDKKRSGWKLWDAPVILNEMAMWNHALFVVVKNWWLELPSAENFTYWEDVCLEKAGRRHIALIGHEMIEYVGGSIDTRQWVRKMNKIDEAMSRNRSPQLETIMNNVYGNLEERYLSEKPITGLSTGYPRLDPITDGLKPMEFWVIAARPSVGKTTVACNLIRTLGVGAKVPMIMFSLEMSTLLIGEKLLFMTANVSRRAHMEKRLSNEDGMALLHANLAIQKSPIEIIDAAMTIQDITKQAVRAVRDSGAKVVIVDYLQRVAIEGGKSEQWERIGIVSNSLKNLAMETESTVVALAQISRKVESENREPTMSDLRGSGEIEQDADVIMFLHKDATEKRVEAIVAKARMGFTGSVRLAANYDTGRFEEYRELPDEDDYRAQQKALI